MEPEDISLMPPIHDTRFWYHALIGQISLPVMFTDCDEC